MGTADIVVPASRIASPWRASTAVAFRRFRDVWVQIRHSRTAMVGFGLLVFFTLMAILAPLVAPYGPNERTPTCNALGQLCGPSADHPLGTSFNNEDVLSQVIWGSQVSLFVGVLSAIVASVVGTTVGLISGFAGGWIDEVLMRINDVVLSVPWLVLMIVIAGIVGIIDLWGIIAVIGLTGWSLTARVIRAQVLSVKERMFVERARMVGSSNWHLLWRHIFPNAFPLIFANTILTVAISIISEAVLAFLNLSPTTVVSWGRIIDDAREGGALINNNAGWLIAPGLCIVFLVFGFYLFGYALDEILNPRLRRR